MSPGLRPAQPEALPIGFGLRADRQPDELPLGEKAFSNYLGKDRKLWRDYDSSVLIGEAKDKLPLLVDQGGKDQFLSEQLKPEALRQAVKENDYPLVYRQQDGYDQSYYFIASFIEDHLRFHADFLKGRSIAQWLTVVVNKDVAFFKRLRLSLPPDFEAIFSG